MERRQVDEHGTGVTRLGLLAPHRRVDHARCDRADARADLAEAHRFAPDQPVHATLAPRVGHAGVLDLGTDRLTDPLEEAVREGIVENGVRREVPLVEREQRGYRREADDRCVGHCEHSARLDESRRSRSG